MAHRARRFDRPDAWLLGGERLSAWTSFALRAGRSPVQKRSASEPSVVPGVSSVLRRKTHGRNEPQGKGDPEPPSCRLPSSSISCEPDPVVLQKEMTDALRCKTYQHASHSDRDLSWPDR